MSSVNQSTHAGISLVEIIVAVSIISAALFALAAVSRVAFRSVSEASHRIQASFLLEEGFEALKMMRDGDWTTISSVPLNAERFPVFSNGSWSATTAETLIDGMFRRTVMLREVFRNPADDSIAQTGTSDPNTRQADIKVEWDERGAHRSISTVTYITNLFLE